MSTRSRVDAAWGKALAKDADPAKLWDVDMSWVEGLGGNLGRKNFFSTLVAALSKEEAIKKALKEFEKNAEFDSDQEPKVERVKQRY